MLVEPLELKSVWEKTQACIFSMKGIPGLIIYTLSFDAVKASQIRKEFVRRLLPGMGTVT